MVGWQFVIVIVIVVTRVTITGVIIMAIIIKEVVVAVVIKAGAIMVKMARVVGEVGVEGGVEETATKVERGLLRV